MYSFLIVSCAREVNFIKKVSNLCTYALTHFGHLGFAISMGMGGGKEYRLHGKISSNYINNILILYIILLYII